MCSLDPIQTTLAVPLCGSACEGTAALDLPPHYLLGLHLFASNANWPIHLPLLLPCKLKRLFLLQYILPR